MIFAYERKGGLEIYRTALWSRLAFAARYGNQSIEVLFRSRSEDIENLNRALDKLISEENKT